MVGAIQQRSLDAYDRIAGQWSLFAGLLYALLNSREIVLRNGSTENLLFKYIWMLEITRWLKLHHNITELSMSAGLLLIASLDLRTLPNRLTISKARLRKNQGHIITLLDFGCDDIELLIADAIQKGLTVLWIRDRL